MESVGWHHVEQLPVSRLHAEWCEIVAAAARRFGYDGVRASSCAGRAFTPSGGVDVSVFTLTTPNSAVLRSMIEELPVRCVSADGSLAWGRLVDIDGGVLLALRRDVPDEEIVAVETAGLDFDALLDPSA